MSPVGPINHNEMVTKKRQRDTDEGLLEDNSQGPIAQQPDVSVKAENSPQACGMQQLVGHQRASPRGAFDVCLLHSLKY
jgi:hypothetical protein